MQLHIDNLDGTGIRDYTAEIDASRTPRVVRKLNDVSELRLNPLITPSEIQGEGGASSAKAPCWAGSKMVGVPVARSTGAK